MNIGKKEFQQQLQEGQELLLEVIAYSPEVPLDKFYKVATVLEYLNLFSGVIYGVIQSSEEKKRQK